MLSPKLLRHTIATTVGYTVIKRIAVFIEPVEGIEHLTGPAVDPVTYAGGKIVSVRNIRTLAVKCIGQIVEQMPFGWTSLPGHLFSHLGHGLGRLPSRVRSNHIKAFFKRRS